MKKNQRIKYILLIVPLFVFSTTTAQPAIGFKGGYGYGQYFFQRTAINQEFISLYNGGLVFQYLNENKAGVQTSLLYMQKGWIEKSVDGAKAEFLMDFIEFEMLSYLKFSKKKEHGLFIKFGPYIGYSFKSTYTLSATTDTLALNYDSLQTAYKKFDYGLAVGLSYTIKIKSTDLQLALLYRQGFYNILEKDPAGIFQSIGQSLFVNIAYIIPFKSRNIKSEEALKPD